MRITLVILILFLFSTFSYAQDYRNAVGVRGGVSYGVTYQMFKDDVKALNTMLSFRGRGLQATAMLTTYYPINWQRSDNFFFYTGMGAHLGFITRYKELAYYHFGPSTYHYEDTFRPVIGLDGLLGIECRFYNVPLAITLDIKPYFDLFGVPIFKLEIFDIGLGIKYTINKR